MIDKCVFDFGGRCNKGDSIAFDDGGCCNDLLKKHCPSYKPMRQHTNIARARKAIDAAAENVRQAGVYLAAIAEEQR
jgi:hypothetical protein